MADIHFQDDAFREAPIGPKPLLVRWVLATGLVSSDAAAQRVLVGTSLVLIVTALALPFFERPASPHPTPQQTENARNAPGFTAPVPALQ